MSEETRKHLGDDLSAYIDGALGDERRKAVDEHLSGCSGCRIELDALKRVSKLVGGLPDKELPDGFMTRLKMKRLESERSGYTPLGWLPAPARMAAFAATGLMAGVVFFNEVRYRLAPKILPDLESTASMAEGDGRRALDAMTPEEIEKARRELVAKSASAPARETGWTGVETQGRERAASQGVVEETARLLERSAGGAAAVRGFEADEAAPAAPAEKKAERLAAANAPGAPVGAGQPFTNDDLRAYLDAESRRMGIRQIVPTAGQDPSDPWAGVPNRPLTKEEARKVMARVTARLRRSNREARAANNPMVPLTGSTPVLLGAEPASRPVSIASSALAQRRRARVPAGRIDVVSVPGSKFAATADQAEAFLEEGQRLEQVQGRREYTEKEGRELAKAKRDADRNAAYGSPKPLLAKDMKKEQGLEDTAGLEHMPVHNSWGHHTGGLGTLGGAVLTNATHFEDLWRRVGRTAPAPAVDFDKEMVVAVFGRRSESPQRVSIVSVARQGGRVLIRYRLTPADGVEGPTSPYHVVTVDRADLPFAFVQVP